MKLSAMIVSMLFLLEAPPGQLQLQQQLQKGSIEGTVVRVGSSEPVAGARILLAKAPVAPVAGIPNPVPPGTPILLQNPILAATTDSQGKFVVKDLDVGSYRLTMVANGYVSQEYGQRATGSPGTPINLAASQALKDIVVRLTPAGNVTGRITEESGRPAVGAQVQLLRASYNANGQKTLQSAGQTRTNDRGEYRLFWVTPGRYYLNAGARSGPILAARSGVGESLNGFQETYAPTYYPGVTEINDASVIEVQSGIELSAIDLRVPMQQLHRIRGRVIDARTGQLPPAVSLSLSSRGTAGTGGTTQTMTQNYNASDGTFELRDIAPGTYGIAAQISDSNQLGLIPQGGPPRPTAVAAVTVSNADVDGIVLSVAMGLQLPGRMTVEGQDLSAVPGLERLRVQLTNSDSVVPFVQSNPQAQPVNADGTFREDNTLPGQYRVAVTALPANFYIKEARFDQTDVLNKPLQFTGSVPTPLDIVLSPKAGQLDGTVLNDRQQPAPGTQAVLIPDQHRDRIDLYKTAVADHSGHFTIRGITPGEYKVFAWEALEQFAYFDSDLLRRFETQGKPVPISESQKVIVEVKLIPAGQ